MRIWSRWPEPVPTVRPGQLIFMRFCRTSSLVSSSRQSANIPNRLRLTIRSRRKATRRRNNNLRKPRRPAGFRRRSTWGSYLGIGKLPSQIGSLAIRPSIGVRNAVASVLYQLSVRLKSKLNADDPPHPFQLVGIDRIGRQFALNFSALFTSELSPNQLSRYTSTILLMRVVASQQDFLLQREGGIPQRETHTEEPSSTDVFDSYYKKRPIDQMDSSNHLPRLKTAQS